MAAGVARLWVLAGVCLRIHGSYPSNTVQMNEICGDTYRVMNPFLLRLTRRGENYHPNMICGLRLQAQPNYRLRFDIESVKIHSSSRSCRDYLEILNGYGSSSYSLTRAICDKESLPDKSLITTHEKALVWFRSDGSGEDEGFEIIITPTLEDNRSTSSLQDNTPVFIGIAVATSVLLLGVAVGMCWCIYKSKRKQQRRQRRRRSRQNTLQLQMTLELSRISNPTGPNSGISNPAGPPPTPDVTAPAYSPAGPPPAYSTLPRRHKPDNADNESGEAVQGGEVTPDHIDQPPPYDQHM